MTWPTHAASKSSPSDPPLRQGSSRAIASTANNFAREVFIDELAVAAKIDPLQFRLVNLDNARLKNVLQTAADKYEWNGKASKERPNVGIGMACGTEKASYLATLAEVSIDEKTEAISVTRVTQAFDCGPIHNPAGLMSQVQGAIMMSLGAALRGGNSFRERSDQEFQFRRLRPAAFR
jgi:isoquinoline 1-oxidoreductase